MPPFARKRIDREPCEVIMMKLLVCAIAATTAAAWSSDSGASQDWTTCPTSTGWIENDMARARAPAYRVAPTLTLSSTSYLRGRTRTASG